MEHKQNIEIIKLSTYGDIVLLYVGNTNVLRLNSSLDVAEWLSFGRVNAVRQKVTNPYSHRLTKGEIQMIKLNLKANGEPQKRIKEYLEQSASEVLADKINLGTEIEKDGKNLISKKTLDGFMRYATEEARKIAEKGSNYACVSDDVVFGWAIHYFEEDSIEEKLYNEDGTEYVKAKASAPKKSAQKKTSQKADTKKPEHKPEPKPIEKPATPKKIISLNQVSIFDL